MKLVRQLPLMMALGLCAPHAFADGDSAQISFQGSIKVPPCTVDTVPTVKMGTDIPMSTFTGKGSTSPAVKFQVSMTCPAGIKALSYQLAPAGGSTAVDAPNGVLSLLNTEGASGVAVKLTDDKNAPIPLQQNISIKQYDPAKFNQTITMAYNAAYIQTDQNVKGGEADAAATLTLSYE
ncbi:fimbrial protein (plasmid) [Burkholderia pyrrocinia]|uniref:fimbrial protein n=1 Tax=Burkholderia pyrrocinia TaxID=60550 RepID=UPI0038B50C5A